MAQGPGSPGGGGGGLGGGRAGGGSPGGGRIGSPGGRSGGQRAVPPTKPAPTPAAQPQGPPPVANKPKSPEPYRPKTAAPHPSQNSSAANQAALAERPRTPAPEPLPLATDPVNKRPAPAGQKPVDKPVNNMGAKNDPQKAERKIPKEYLPDRAERNKIRDAVNSPHIPKDKKIEARRAFLEAAVDRKRSEAQEKQQNKPAPAQQTTPSPAEQSSNTPKPAKRTAHRDGWPKLNQQKEINKNVERSMKEAKDFQELTGLPPGKHDKRQAYRSQIDAKRALNKYGDETKANKIKEARDNKIATETNRRAILNGQAPPIPLQRQGREPAPASRGSTSEPTKAINAQQRQNGHSTAVADRPAFRVAPLAPPPPPRATNPPPAPTRASPSLSAEQKQKYHATAQTLPAESRRQYYRDMIGGTQRTRQEAEQRATQAAQWQPPPTPPKPAVSAPRPQQSTQPHVTRRTRPPGEDYKKAADWPTPKQKKKIEKHARSLSKTDTREGRDARRAYYRDTIEARRQENRAQSPRPSLTERMRNAFNRAPAPTRTQAPAAAPAPAQTQAPAQPNPLQEARDWFKSWVPESQRHKNRQPRIHEHRDVQTKSFVPHKARRPPAHKETWGRWFARQIAPGPVENLDRAKIEAQSENPRNYLPKLLGIRKGVTLPYKLSQDNKRERISIQYARDSRVISPPRPVEGRELAWSRVADQSLIHSAKEHRSNHGVTAPWKRPKPAEMPVRYKHTPPAHRKTFQLSQMSAISAPQPPSIYAPTNQPIGLSQSYQQKQNGAATEEFYAPRKGRPKRIAAGPRFDDYQDELNELFPEGVPGKAQPQQQQSNGAAAQGEARNGPPIAHFVDPRTFDPAQTTHRIGDDKVHDCLDPNCPVCCTLANANKPADANGQVWDGKSGIEPREAIGKREWHYHKDHRNFPEIDANKHGRLYEEKKKNQQQVQQKQAHEAENHQMRSSL